MIVKEIEKRFKNLFKKVKNTDDYLSIPLTKDLHKTITKICQIIKRRFGVVGEKPEKIRRLSNA